MLFDSDSKSRYTIKETGETPVGVTSVLGKTLAKEGLMLWPLYMALTMLKGKIGQELTLEHLSLAEKAHTKKSDKGKDVGTEVHFLIEQHLKGNKTHLTDSYSKEAIKAYNAFRLWFDSQKIKVLEVERILYSRGHDYAGTTDALLEIDGQLTLVDIKTTNSSRTAPRGIYPEYFIQLGAYSYAHHEEGGARVKDLMVINANKSGELSTCTASELGLSVLDCERAWRACLKLYRFLAPLSRKLGES